MPKFETIKSTLITSLRDHSYRVSLLLTILNVTMTFLALYLLYTCE